MSCDSIWAWIQKTAQRTKAVLSSVRRRSWPSVKLIPTWDMQKWQTKPKLLGKRGCTSVRRMFRWGCSRHLTIFQKASSAHHYRILSNVQMQISPRSKFCNASSVASGGHAYRVKRSWQGWVRNDFKNKPEASFCEGQHAGIEICCLENKADQRAGFSHILSKLFLESCFPNLHLLELSWWILMAYDMNVIFVAAILLTCKSQRRRSSLACQSQHVSRRPARTWIKLS